MNFLEKHSKKIALALCFATCVPVVSAVYAYEAQPGWHGEGADRYYVLESTREQATGWLHLDEGTYYFNEEGEMVFGWQEIDSFQYYFGSNGKMVSGEQTIDDVNYYFQKDGRLLKGWNEDYLYDDHGFAVTEQYIEMEDGTYVYVDENGQKVTGWKTINGRKHYFYEDGTMATNEVQIGDKTYYLDEYGVLYTGWKYDEDDNAYYLTEYGEMLVDTTKEIDGVEYVFDEYGIATDKETVDREKAEKKRKEEQQKQQQSSSTGSSSSGSSVSGSYNGSASGIVSAALAQLGVNQDCTMLVTNALAANGIYFHSAPAGYLSLGVVTNDPQPGDLIYYADGGLGMAHIAVYIGGGQAVHGGWHGNQTVISSAYVGSGPVFIRIK